MSTHRNVFGIRLTALLEILFGLIALVLVDQFLAQGNAFWHLQPNPFWIVVLLISAQYGVNESIIAALFTSLVYLFFGDWPVRAEGEEIYQYYFQVLQNPIMWFVAAFITGFITERHLRKVVRLDRELDDSRHREETISESYAFVKERKEDLETQLAGRITSSVQAYKAAKAVETLNPKDVLRGVEELITAILSPQKFSVYTLQNDKLVANVLHGWSQQDDYKQEIDSYDPLYQAVVGSQQTLCVANQDQEIALNKQGLLAGPVTDPASGRVIGMVKIEQMPFVNLGLNSIETFKALCEWVGSSLVNAENYQIVKEDSVINPEHNLMTSNFFKRQSDYLTALAKRVNCDLSLIVVRMNDTTKLDDEVRLQVARRLSDAVKKVLRNVDLAFEYQNTGEEYSILLPATSQQGANVVRDKIAKELAGVVRNQPDSGFSYHIKALHEA